MIVGLETAVRMALFPFWKVKRLTEPLLNLSKIKGTASIPVSAV